MQGDNENVDRGEDAWTNAILAQKDVARTTEPGSWFQYRPGRLIVDTEAVGTHDAAGEEIRALLDRAGAKPAPGRHGKVAEQLGITIYEVPEDQDVPALSTRIGAVAPGVASLDHVLVADPHRFGGSSPAIPAAKPSDIPGASGAGKGLTVAVLDTGVEASVVGIAPVPPIDDEILDEDGDKDLDPAAGHGTFVTGVIRRYAPEATVVAVRLLKTPAGLASELEVAEALLSLPKVDVINCSFGGPAQNDAPPLVIERALAMLDPHTVVVAAAGNEGLNRPHWPGASKRAFAIGSVEHSKERNSWHKAEYSNYGWWLDASAAGSEVHSVFVDFTEAGPLPNRTFCEGAIWSGTSFATPKVVGAILALASRDGISARKAAYRLIQDPSRPRLPSLGTLVQPTVLP